MLSENEHSWKIAWQINHEIKTNDKRIIPYIDEIIKCIDLKKDGHQRELLKIVQKMELNEYQNGTLFKQCLIIWRNTSKIPSVRIKAFQILIKITIKYPELKKELIHYTSAEYTNTLGKGIRKSFENIMNNVFQN